ncbi:glycosyltransferase [Paracoccus hibiscisoli]|uniref:Glycosyltransferase family 1 protein n=1 Tax=Paracoccus hibiscisoli TaxID=2023261 RepID=A0A4U0QRH3_9RHOB|nr:glycosyltransferase [Paracoccus hibiscisoli]TJZ84537.1 glycosyltransferase family 1 protein [Paracoccus hibiscisoli]
MAHHQQIGSRVMLICPPYHSHLQAFDALACALRARGHQVRSLTQPGPPPDTGRGLRHEVRIGAARTDALCRSGPAQIARFRPDLILGDQTEPAAGLLARHLGVPMVSIACALPFDAEPTLPLPFLGWSPVSSPRAIERLKTARRIAQWVMGPQSRVITAWSAAWGLGDRRDFTDCVSDLMTLSQTAPGFDHPRPFGGHRIRYTGLFCPPLAGPFPDDIRPDPDRPLIYVSLGTLQGHRLALLSRIARACTRAGAQVLVTHGGALTPDQARRIPATWVRDFVPQRAILTRADLCVTHGGLNTAMECLEQGVPMLALPLTNDQPGVAARIVASGTGLRLTPAFAIETRILAALRRLLADRTFRDRAHRFARQSAAWPRAAGAVDLIETLLPSHGRSDELAHGTQGRDRKAVVDP